jgi:transcriptional regulator NrdR family protein
MLCPVCGAKLRVWGTQNYDTVAKRTRLCPKCRFSFVTDEEIPDYIIQAGMKKREEISINR